LYSSYSNNTMMGTENLYTRPGQPIKASSASLRSDCGGNKRI